MVPPTLKRSIGRPSRNRRREAGEKRKGKRSTSIKCKRCQCFGHNSKTCEGGYTAREKEEMQGKVFKGRTKRHDITQFKSLDELEASIISGTSTQVPLLVVAGTSTQGQSSNGRKRKAT